ncbi:hypothetical protein ACQEXU_13180 [Vibrio sp. TRT 21S02]|uniref:hypothetical protein n=1 Tax=Vibrio sp. TRT 21S02 TaxID=3418507 RepID=UPI003CF67A75
MVLKQRSTTLNLVMVLAIITIIYLIARSLAKGTFKALDSAANNVTKPAGDVLSDITSSINGHQPVELTALVIDDHHLNWDYTLTSEAERVFWKVPEYQGILYKLFGTKGRAMKPQYRHLIGRPLTEDSI